MARILFAWELGANRGHWANIQPLAKKLAKAGHEIFLASRVVSVGPQAGESNLPMTVVQSPHLSAPEEKKIKQVHALPHILHNVGYYETHAIASLVRAWQSLYRFIEPEMILFEHSPTALLAARGADCRRVLLGSGFVIPPNCTPLPDIQPWQPAVHRQLEQDESVVLERMNRVLAENRCDSLASVSRLYAEVDETFLQTFPEIDHYGQRSGSRYWGVSSSTGTVAPEWNTGTEGRRIFAYLRKFDGLFELLELLSRDAYDVVAYIANHDPQLVATYANATTQLHTQPLNLSAISGQCDMGVLHGGATTVAELLLQGIPSLLLPEQLEQALMGYRLTQNQLGAICPTDKPEAYKTAIEAMLTESHWKANAQRFAQQYEGFDASVTLQGMAERVCGLI